MTTRKLALTDTLGNLVRFRLMPGQRYDSVEVPPLIDGIPFDGLIADKAFRNALVAELNERGAKGVISQHPGRAQKLKIDTAIYTRRHLIENLFCKLKAFMDRQSGGSFLRVFCRCGVYRAGPQPIFVT